MNAAAPQIAELREHETRLQRVVTVWIATGLLFMLAPGTFLGVLNLIGISNSQSGAAMDPAWLQAHGHAQIFGWIGSFIIGIGFYSLSKMAKLSPVSISRAWTSWALWTSGVLLRWLTNLYAADFGVAWRILLPFSAALELAGFILFFITVRSHRPEPSVNKTAVGRPPVWMRIVILSTFGFFVALAANFVSTIWMAARGSGPALPHLANQHLLPFFSWGFPVLAVWGFNARWLPVFLGLREGNFRLLGAAVAAAIAGLACTAVGAWTLFGVFSLAAAILSATALRVFTRSVQKPKIQGVHPSFPFFVRAAYVWLIVSALLSILAARWDTSGGLWGASRHALTVGFLASMVFAIGQRVLPAFCGMHVLFSPRLMFASLALLMGGCALRVCAEIGAYQGYVPALWPLLPVSAVIEMTAVTLFAGNLLITIAPGRSARAVTAPMPDPLPVRPGPRS
jgi:hypothetical protein